MTFALALALAAAAGGGGEAGGSCGELTVLRLDGRRYHETRVTPRAGERGGALGRGSVTGCDGGTAVRVSALRGTRPGSAVLAAAGGAPARIFVRAGDLPQLRSHPLHGRLRVPAPDGCSRRWHRLVGVVRRMPAFGDLLDLRVRGADDGVVLAEDGATAVIAVVAGTRERVRRRSGAPFVRRGTTVIAEVSPCATGQNVARTLVTDLEAASGGL